ncbi:L-lactate permease [Syntrophomonas zehnderi OL-4]|uniref:L-lactate permease n=1 Tax=Syntrophomonas zehnderi OL-4 TaxID=690567 RepID=A0A0E4GBG1_9FIRM|nr:L-lactate permease [Syntrophomonas zehnderi]CFX68473.1 L-lactate permease [Syntrophomonas zehnderi OL-4]
MSVLLTLVPIIAVLALLILAKWPADLSGFVGWVLVVLIGWLFFQTSLQVGLTASLAGIVASFPVSLMVAASIFQITFLESTGALKRVVVFVKTLAKNDQAVQIMIINMGIGTLLVSVGATPVSILPPIMLALGYSTFVAVALPALGFDSLCTYALLGAPLVVFSDMTGTSLTDSALVFSQFMPIISTMIGFGMLFIVGGLNKVKEGFLPCLLAGMTMGLTAMAVAHIGKGIVLTGVIAGMATVLVMIVYLKLRRQPLLDRSCLTAQDKAIEESLPLRKALGPWLILIISCLIINFWPPLFNLLFNDLAFPLQIIPGGKPVNTRFLWNAYTWVIISTLLAVPFLKPSRAQWQEILSKWWQRAPRPTFSAAIFFAIAYVMMFSGYAPTASGWALIKPDYNMISVLAVTSADFFNGLYPAAAAFLGLLGGFVSGSEASAIALFTKYNIMTSEILKIDPLVVTAGMAISAGLASVISPAKLQNAAATIDALGIESKVIKIAIPIALIFTTVAALLTFIWA